MSYWTAILKKRCPGCMEGGIYGPDGKMNVRCPKCGLLLEREQGYFLGAMYISYALATIILGLFTGTLVLLFPDLDLGVAVLIAGAVFIPFVPGVTRYSRVLWIYFDRWAWPESPGTGGEPQDSRKP